MINDSKHKKGIKILCVKAKEVEKKRKEIL